MADPTRPLTLADLWLPVRGFEGLYEVSSCGAVRSVERLTSVKDPRTGGSFLRRTPQRLLSLHRNGSGYFAVKMYRSNVLHTEAVGRLGTSA